MNKSTEQKFDAVVAAPFGALGVQVDETGVVSIAFLPPGTQARPAQTPLAERACVQLQAYLDNPKRGFKLPLKPVGTPFQQRVWDAIAAIPRGETLTYGDIARELKSAPRAVGQACGRNPLPVVVPCHRVIAARGGLNGGLGGFARSGGGYLLEAKRWLLAHEGAL